MPTTTIRLPNALKARVARVAKHAGNTAHGAQTGTRTVSAIERAAEVGEDFERTLD